jgi:conjugal transfer/entry exclusion protein
LAASQIGSADSQELQDQALVLEEQSEQLLQERQRLQEQTSALENQLRNLRKQLQRREESEQDAVLSKEEILRSITELQTVMMEDLNTVHFDDITELTKRLLQEILRKDQQQMVLNRSAIESMQEILAGLDDGDFDYRTLRGSIIR